MIIAEINSFAKNKASQLTILQGACLIENPNSEINIIQDYARLAYRLNSKKSRCTYYDKEILDTMKKEQELNDLFENSIKNKDFHMFLQPKIIISNNKIGGAEALVRWFHPERGTIYHLILFHFSKEMIILLNSTYIYSKKYVSFYRI